MIHSSIVRLSRSSLRGLAVLRGGGALAACAIVACGFDGVGTGPSVGPGGATGEQGTSSSGGDGATPGNEGGPGPSDAMTNPDAVVLPDPLTLTWANAPANVDLEVEGTLGWIHFGTETNDKNSFNEKASAKGMLPRYTVTGSTDVRTYEDNFTLFTWTNGSDQTTEPGTRNGVYSKTGFPKFHMDRIVGTQAQRWVVYAGVYKCKALLTVTLGAGPTAPKVTAALDSTNKAYGRYVIEHRAPLPNTSLALTWELTQAYDPNNSNVTFAASTLSAIP